MESETPQACRVTSDRRRADDWVLALASAAIDARLDWGPAGYMVLVRGADRARADAVLDAFDAENRPRPVAAEVGAPGFSRGAIAVAVLLCAFFVVTGPRDAGSVWFARGSSVAARVAAGELWRCVTALTLHADFPHIVTNAVTLVLFGTALCAMLGTGIAVWLMLLSGAAGNWLTAVLRGAPYGAVGASTAIFGALGALAAVQVVRRRRGAPVPIWRALMPVAALDCSASSARRRNPTLAHCSGSASGLFGLVAVRRMSRPDRDSIGLPSRRWGSRRMPIIAGVGGTACLPLRVRA
jgi:membrane associated rhomboid family serine protease